MQTIITAISGRVAYVLGGVLAGILLTLSFSHTPAYQGTTLASIDSGVKHHDVKTNKPIQALDKKELKEQGMISSEVVKDDNKEVLATGISSGHDGTKEVSAVLDTTSGLSHIEEKRPFSEWMHVASLSAGITAGTLGIGEELNLNTTLFRVGNLYGDIALTGWRWEQGNRLDNGHKYDGQVSAMLRWNF